MEATCRPVDWTGDRDMVRRFFSEYREWLAAHSDPAEESRLRVNEGMSLIDRLIAGLPGSYGPPQGDVLLWFEGGNVVACGALRDLEPTVAEFKRLYVRPDHRGGTFGLPFVRELKSRARALGYEKLRTDTLPTMAGAIEFLEESNFHRIPSYWPHPVAGAVFFEARLAE